MGDIFPKKFFMRGQTFLKQIYGGGGGGGVKDEIMYFMP